MRRTEAKIIAAGKNRSNYVDILALANEVSEEEFHCMTDVFHSPVATITLIDEVNAADVTVSAIVPGQLAPLFHTTIFDYKDVIAVNDKRSQYLEFIGKILSEEYTRQNARQFLGIRVHIKPDLRVDTFFVTDN